MVKIIDDIVDDLYKVTEFVYTIVKTKLFMESIYYDSQIAPECNDCTEKTMWWYIGQFYAMGYDIGVNHNYDEHNTKIDYRVRDKKWWQNACSQFDIAKIPAFVFSKASKIMRELLETNNDELNDELLYYSAYSFINGFEDGLKDRTEFLLYGLDEDIVSVVRICVFNECRNTLSVRYIFMKDIPDENALEDMNAVKDWDVLVTSYGRFSKFLHEIEEKTFDFIYKFGDYNSEEEMKSSEELIDRINQYVKSYLMGFDETVLGICTSKILDRYKRRANANVYDAFAKENGNDDKIEACAERGLIADCDIRLTKAVMRYFYHECDMYYGDFDKENVFWVISAIGFMNGRRYATGNKLMLTEFELNDYWYTWENKTFDSLFENINKSLGTIEEFCEMIKNEKHR